MNKLLSGFLILFVCFTFSCKNTNSSDTTQTESTTNTTESNPETNPQIKENNTTILYTWVDKLNLRDQPSTKSKIVAELKEGSELTFLNEKTDYKERINLRGQLLNEPWLKVKTDKNIEGWVFGGAVKFYKPVVDANPSPYDNCFLLQKDRKKVAAEQCFKNTRKAQLLEDKKFVAEVEEGIVLNLLAGDKKEIFHLKHPDSSMITHAYIDYLPRLGFFVVKNYYFEAIDYSLVNDKSGNITKINGFPKTSPDNKYFVTTNVDIEIGFGNNGIEIYGFPNGRFSKIAEHSWLEYNPVAPRWVDNETIEVTLLPIENPQNTNKPKSIEIKLDAEGKWNITD